jgi:hypothetical protein
MLLDYSHVKLVDTGKSRDQGGLGGCEDIRGAFLSSQSFFLHFNSLYIQENLLVILHWPYSMLAESPMRFAMVAGGYDG